MRRFLLTLVAFLGIGCTPDPYLDENVLREIVQNSQDQGSLEAKMSYIREEIEREYPKVATEDDEFLFNIAGGVLLQINLVYCGRHEYVLFFGAPVGSEGYSGQYKAQIWDFLIEGHIEDYHLGDTSSTVHTDETHMVPGDHQGFRVEPGTWVLEYGRGNIPHAIRFGVRASGRNGTLGPKGAKAQLRKCMELMRNRHKQ